MNETAPQSPLRVIPLGGLGEIGLNMMAFEYENSIMVVDAGLMFPEDYMLGVDVVIPDFDFLRSRRDKVAGIVLTHSHEDHIGGLSYLLKEVDAPVYATPFTLGLVRTKLDEKDLLSRARLVSISPREEFSVGPFVLEAIRVSHSVVDGVGLAIRTPLGLLVHTGDFKISYGSKNFGSTDLGRFAQLGEEGILMLFSDSTNAEKEGYTLSEEEIGRTLENIFAKSRGRIIVAVFASNIPRIAQLLALAKKSRRKILFNGRSIEVTVNMAAELGYLNIPPSMEIGVDELSDYPDDEILIVTTGSQGEPMSALARMAAGQHRQIRVKKDDTVILSSKFIPGNEKAITSIINRLYRQGAEVIYEKISDIHVSGHAFREELKVMLQLTRPRYLVPVHGEYRHLVHHKRLAMQVGMPAQKVLLAENGNVITIDREGARITDKVETGRTLVDGKGIGDVGRSVLRERRALSEHGIVVITMIIDQETGVVLYGPELASRGFVFEDEKGHLLEDAQCVILEIVEDVRPDLPDRLDRMRSRIQKALRQYFSFVIQRRPLILPVILEV